jgi:hypothetical protein
MKKAMQPALADSAQLLPGAFFVIRRHRFQRDAYDSSLFADAPRAKEIRSLESFETKNLNTFTAMFNDALNGYEFNISYNNVIKL